MKHQTVGAPLHNSYCRYRNRDLVAVQVEERCTNANTISCTVRSPAKYNTPTAKLTPRGTFPTFTDRGTVRNVKYNTRYRNHGNATHITVIPIAASIPVGHITYPQQQQTLTKYFCHLLVPFKPSNHRTERHPPATPSTTWNHGNETHNIVIPIFARSNSTLADNITYRQR